MLVILLRAEARVCVPVNGDIGGKNVKYACDRCISKGEISHLRKEDSRCLELSGPKGSSPQS
jgi:hypothetical protein